MPAENPGIQLIENGGPSRTLEKFCGMVLPSRLRCNAIANFPPTLDAGPRRRLRRGPAGCSSCRRKSGRWKGRWVAPRRPLPLPLPPAARPQAEAHSVCSALGGDASSGWRIDIRGCEYADFQEVDHDARALSAPIALGFPTAMGGSKELACALNSKPALPCTTTAPRSPETRHNA